MKKKEQKKMSFNEIETDNIPQKFGFIIRAGKKILHKRKDEKGQPGLDTYLEVLADMIQKENKKDEK